MDVGLTTHWIGQEEGAWLIGIVIKQTLFLNSHFMNVESVLRPGCIEYAIPDENKKAMIGSTDPKFAPRACLTLWNLSSPNRKIIKDEVKIIYFCQWQLFVCFRNVSLRWLKACVVWVVKDKIPRIREQSHFIAESVSSRASGSLFGSNEPPFQSKSSCWWYSHYSKNTPHRNTPGH